MMNLINGILMILQIKIWWLIDVNLNAKLQEKIKIYFYADCPYLGISCLVLFIVFNCHHFHGIQVHALGIEFTITMSLHSRTSTLIHYATILGTFKITGMLTSVAADDINIIVHN